MRKSISDKIIDSHTVSKQSNNDQFVEVKVDMVLGHDATIALLIKEFENRNLEIWDKDRVLFTNDHFSPPATVERAEISAQFIEFSLRHAVTHLKLDEGICHQLMVEHKLCAPGSLIVGADSHTIMGGALGACCTGMGSTDILYALATGTTWMQKPKSIKVEFSGSMPEQCNGRDVILELLARLGEEGGQYKSIEFHDHCSPKISQDDRFAISNMAVEMGAKFGLFVPDEVTIDYCQKRDGYTPHTLVYPDDDAEYESVIYLDLSTLTPRVAKPWSPANVVPLEEIDYVPITTAFLGSCSSGRLKDLQEAAEVFKNPDNTTKKIFPHIRFVVIPGSRDIYLEAMKKGYLQTLIEAGAVVNQPSCGPCGGIDKGVLGRGDICVSTSNRNFLGRMGHKDSKTYLASPKVVAKAALLGGLYSNMLSTTERVEPELREDYEKNIH